MNKVNDNDFFEAFKHILLLAVSRYKFEESRKYELNNHLQFREGHIKDTYYLDKLRETIITKSSSFINKYDVYGDLGMYCHQLKELVSNEKNEEKLFDSYCSSSITVDLINRTFFGILNSKGLDAKQNLFQTLVKEHLELLGYSIEEFKKIQSENIIILNDEVEIFIEKFMNLDGLEWFKEYLNIMGQILFLTSFMIAPQLACIDVPVTLQTENFGELFHNEKGYNKVMKLLEENNYITRNGSSVEWTPPCYKKYKLKYLTALMDVLTEREFINEPPTKHQFAKLIKDHFNINFSDNYFERHREANDFPEIKQNFFFIT